MGTAARVDATGFSNSIGPADGPFRIHGDNIDFADPDQDGRPNLVEYALGTDPRRPDLGGLAVTSSPETLTLTYQLDTSKSDISCLPETSIDLRDWSRVGSTLVGTTGTLETRSVSIPASAAAGSRNYLRLRITSTPGAPVKAGAPPDR